MKLIGCLCLLAAVGQSETLTVKPNRYYETFSTHEPVARIKPGDTVVTKLLDSRGRDETGKLILDGDNVLTGPFYVEGVEPGDTLVVKLDKVRLNRDWGWNGVRMAGSSACAACSPFSACSSCRSANSPQSFNVVLAASKWPLAARLSGTTRPAPFAARPAMLRTASGQLQ